MLMGQSYIGSLRLMAHLGSNYLMFLLILWAVMNYWLVPYDHSHIRNMDKIRGCSLASLFFILYTIAVGSLVAATDAGRVMNIWPSYDGHFWPSTAELFPLSPFYRNFYDNPVMVQFIHRHAAYLTLAMVAVTFVVGYHRMALGRRAKLALVMLLVVGITQASLGVLTLINVTPPAIASLHQLGSLALVTMITWLMFEIRPIVKQPMAVVDHYPILIGSEK